MSNELVSVIIPCYNQAVYLPEAIQSVLEQSYTNWECIIINDGSRDNTEEVAEKWVSKDPRVRYYKIINSGVSAARNLGIEKANGKYILPLDGDDKIHPDYLQYAVSLFEEQPELKLVYCKLKYFGKKNDWILPPYNYRNLLVESMIFSTALMKRNDIIQMGGYDKNMIHGFEDWEFYINFLDEDSKVVQIDKVLFYYRLKESSRDADLGKSQEKLKATLEYISTKHYKTYLKYYGSILEVLRQNKALKERNVLKEALKSKLWFLKS